MKIKKSLLLTLAVLGAQASAQTCQPSATTPYLNINGTTSWTLQSTAAVNTGTTVVLGPQPFSGTWSWSGCGTSGSSREQTIKLTNSGTVKSSCTATATVTNSCGAQSTQQFNFTIWPAMASNASKYIMVDQFGYLSNAKKIAVLRTPHTGYDGSTGNLFWPQQLSVKNAATGATVYSFWPSDWNGGADDPGSGDRVWYFDFSSVTAPGTYEIVDTNGQRSARFEIGDNVYRNVLIQAVRMFYYQRLGQARSVGNAGLNWADSAGNLGTGQDSQAHRFLDKVNGQVRDLRGGWADAGDFNKYTAWEAGYAQDLMDVYVQNPTVFTDDFNIPESYNGIPDILDEAKWGLDYLKRLQNADGSVLSIVGAGGASPPSTSTAPSYYGDVNTTATLATAAAFAHGAKVLGSLNNSSLTTYVADLRQRAINAYNWAVANPNVLFYNNDASHGTAGLGVGQQETDDNGRIQLRVDAAIKLFALTGNTSYRDYVDAHYTIAGMFKDWSLSGFSAGSARGLMYYASLPGATASVASAIRQRYSDLMNRSDYDNWGAIAVQRDAYRAKIGSYTWASNSVKANAGTLFTDEGYYGISTHTADEIAAAASDYLHYLHGVNPLGKVYLSNMNSFGAENSVNQIWHTWFADGTSWDDAKNSPYGPAPAYLIGGPIQGWTWDSACNSATPPSSCGSAPPSPPYNQPASKSYLDFNTGWPMDTWNISEPSNGYQVNYLRLLARFVK